MATNKFREAREAFDLQVQLSPNDPQAHLDLAKAALKLGDAPRCLLAARRAEELDKGNVEAACLVGYALLCQDQNQKAVESLSASVKQSPSDATLHCLLGRAHAASGNPAEARKCYQAAAELDPTSTLAKELLAATAEKASAGLSPTP